MSKLYKYLCAFTFLLFITGCAASYKTIDPEKVSYSNSANVDDLEISYKYNVLSSRGNRRFVKRERKKDLSVIAVKLTNHSNAPFTVTHSNFRIFASNKLLQPVNPSRAAGELKEKNALYLLYSLLFLTISKEDNGEIKQTNLPIGIPIALGNFMVGMSSNSNIRQNFRQDHIYGKTIQPGEQLSGLAYFYDTNFEPLTFTINNNETISAGH